MVFFIAQFSEIPTPSLQIPMLGFSCGYSTTYRRNTMPVQMIELEEVNAVEVSDESLETIVGGFALVPSINSVGGCCG